MQTPAEHILIVSESFFSDDFDMKLPFPTHRILYIKNKGGCASELHMSSANSCVCYMYQIFRTLSTG